MNNNTVGQITRERFSTYSPFRDDESRKGIRAASVWAMNRHLRTLIGARWPDQDPDQVLDAIRDPRYADYVAELWEIIQPNSKVVYERFIDDVLARVTAYMETQQHQQEES